MPDDINSLANISLPLMNTVINIDPTVLFNIVENNLYGVPDNVVFETVSSQPTDRMFACVNSDPKKSCMPNIQSLPPPPPFWKVGTILVYDFRTCSNGFHMP